MGKVTTIPTVVPTHVPDSSSSSVSYSSSEGTYVPDTYVPGSSSDETRIPDTVVPGDSSSSQSSYQYVKYKHTITVTYSGRCGCKDGPCSGADTYTWTSPAEDPFTENWVPTGQEVLIKLKRSALLMANSSCGHEDGSVCIPTGPEGHACVGTFAISKNTVKAE